MKINYQLTATTVKIEKSLYSDFKILGIRHGISLQTFVEKCVQLYVTDKSFQELISSFNPPILSTTGSFTIGNSTNQTGSSIQ